MFTEDEKRIVEQWRGIVSKAAVQNLKPIKVKHTGISDNECGCSKARRSVWLVDFYEWYEAQNR